MFRGNDIVYARHWALGIHLSDGSLVENITFADTTLSDYTGVKNPAGSPYAWLTHGPILFRATIQKDCWGKDPERGRIRNVQVDGVTLYGKAMLPSELNGADAKHDIRGVNFRNIRLAGQPPADDVAGLALKTNAFVREVTCSPSRQTMQQEAGQ